jgi:hypothetical protein
VTLLYKRVLISGGNIDPSILMEISEIYIHPMYNSLSVAHDLAIVETFKGIPFSSKVGPACLPFKYVNNDFVGSTVNVLGKFVTILNV